MRPTDTRDTIAAIATAIGGGIGIVRVSGPDAVAMAERVCARKAPPHAALRRALARHPGTGEPLDDGLLVVFRAPRSFTGEDVAEFHGHGGAAALSAVLGAFLFFGARLALPGEFTERAFLSGKLDLTQAEAVADLVSARTDDARRAAVRQLSGGLREASRRISEHLKRALALLEATIDFPEDVGELDEAAFVNCLSDARCELDALLATRARGRALTDGITVALIGRPNAGKSSLLNALAGSERAIVTPIPGTTRDVLTEPLTLGGLPVRALDTAGLRATTDPIEKIGVERARTAADSADIVLVIADAALGIGSEEHELLALHSPRSLLVVNKIDLAPPGYFFEEGIAVSAKTGAGLDALGGAVAVKIGPESGNVPLLTRARHEDALRRTLLSLENASASLGSRQPPELIAVDVHGALQSLGELTGETSRSEIIAGIFRTFCIGK